MKMIRVFALLVAAVTLLAGAGQARAESADSRDIMGFGPSFFDSGANPIPRKYVITSKGIAEAPQYTLRIKEWKTDVAPDAFTFKADPSFKKIALGEMSDIDEVPQGTTKAGDKK